MLSGEEVRGAFTAAHARKKKIPHVGFSYAVAAPTPPRLATTPWAQATELFLAVLVGSGFALSFGVLRGLPWFTDIELVTSPPFNFQFWTLGLVYLAGILSSVATIRTGAKRPIRSQERFSLSLVLLIIVLAQFTIFVNLGAVIVLFVATFAIYVFWDLLSLREQKLLPAGDPSKDDNIARVRSGAWVSLTWAFIFVALAMVYFWNGGQPTTWAVVWAYAATCGYRLHKRIRWPFQHASPPSAHSVPVTTDEAARSKTGQSPERH